MRIIINVRENIRITDETKRTAENAVTKSLHFPDIFSALVHEPIRLQCVILLILFLVQKMHCIL